MGIYYYEVDKSSKQYFISPYSHSIKDPGIYHPLNPFPQMVVMMNVRGSHFDICDDCSNEVPPDEDYKEISEEVYQELLTTFPEAKHFYENAEKEKYVPG